MADQKLTDRDELDELPADDDLFHMVDISDTSQSPQGSSFKIKLIKKLKTLFVDNEIPSGTVNGVNADFTLANTPSSGSLKVFVNGTRFKLTVDYTLSGAVITFNTAPPTGSEIVCDYRK